MSDATTAHANLQMHSRHCRVDVQPVAWGADELLLEISDRPSTHTFWLRGSTDDLVAVLRSCLRHIDAAERRRTGEEASDG